VKSFKVGDRVRIVCTTSKRNGCEGTIWKTHVWHNWPLHYAQFNGRLSYLVDVDGHGVGTETTYFSYMPEDLEPIVNPDETAWNEFRRYLQPDPAIILAKEPA